MKKLFALVTVLALFVSTSGLVLAQGTTPASTPVTKKVMKVKKTHKIKKSVKPVSSPVVK
jgi:hypothetical protein